MFRLEGIANGSTLDIVSGDEGFQTSLSSTSGLSQKVKGSGNKTVLKQDFRGMSKAVAKAAKAGRKDLTVG